MSTSVRNRASSLYRSNTDILMASSVPGISCSPHPIYQDPSSKAQPYCVETEIKTRETPRSHEPRGDSGTMPGGAAQRLHVARAGSRRLVLVASRRQFRQEQGAGSGI